jgi:putative PEP-CTERM system histidine kinase
MSTDTADIAIFGYAAASLLHALFAALLLPWLRRSPQFTGHNRLAARAFTGAVLVSVLWSLAALADAQSPWLITRHLTMAADWLRYGLWLLFLLALVRPHLAGAWRRSGALPAFTALIWASGALLLLALAALGNTGRGLGEDWPQRLMHAWTLAALGLPVLGLVAVEQLFRNLPEDARWNAKPVCLGLAGVFVFDIYHYSEAVLFGRFDADASQIRGLVHALALPLIFVALRRRADWIRRLQVSRKAAFYSASLLLVGGYLLFVSALGYAVRAFGGDWGRAMQLALLSGALLLGLVVLLSGSMRARLKVFLGKHFFSYRYDYREQWLRFTQVLSATGPAPDVGALVVRGLADMLESPGGSLFLRNAAGTRYAQAARWNLPALEAAEPVEAPLPQYLHDSGWIIDLDEYRSAPKRYGGLALPPWLAEGENFWVLIPLTAHEQLLGWVVLARPRAPVQMNWETRDLVKTASRQAAGFLAQMQATEALLELRKFEAFNRMSAFVVHDLKNIVTQLSLMLKNAERLHANPEFQQDMLLTVQSSLDKMRRLMLQLREGATPPGTAVGVELEPLVRRLQAMARGRGRDLQLRSLEPLSTRGHEERLERVLGHLVHNALDATAQGGEVWMDVQRESGWVKVQVQDTGIGMTEEFVQTRLFRPFSSTKDSGMGIGMHESGQYLRELGGEITVHSRPGEGTCFTVRLPLFDVHPERERGQPADHAPGRASEQVKSPA